MGLRINTNIGAMNAIMNLNSTNNKLSQSLNRLSTGLRITKAADDSAGMTIADGLKFQATNLGQAISNGNNGVKLIQIADMALQKSIDIIGSIAQKATQAANDTEDDGSRKALQSDIDKLLEEINNISNTTSYKGTKLLDGSFVNKFLQVGAYADQTLSLGITKTSSTAIGKTASASGNDATYSDSLSGTTTLSYDSSSQLNEINAGQLTINGVDINNYIDGSASTSQLDAKQMAAAINQVQDATGVTATAVNTLIASAALQTTTIADGDLKINGVNIGATDNANLVADINAVSDETGVTASINDDNELALAAADGRNIAVETTSAVAGAIHIQDNTTELTAGGISLADVTTASGIHSFAMNGIDIQYGETGAANEGLASVAAQIRSALAAAGVTDITVTSNGSMNSMAFTINDGHDLNTYNGSATTSGAMYKVANSSAHGAISLTSDKDITIAGTTPEIGGFTPNTYTPTGSLSKIDVTTQSGAESAITTSKSALDALDSIRSGLGSVQNQIQATVENLSVTQINIKGAESSIRDVNFADESSNFSKLQILAQSGTYALSQSNAVQQNVLRLLQ